MSYYNIYEETRMKHYQVPKVFMTSDKYKNMSNDAKIAWSILKDRFDLSVKNEWFDDLGNIYFIYTNDDLQEILNCKKDKVLSIKKELKENNLLEQKRMGLNKPNRLYIKKPEVTKDDVYKIKNQEKEGSTLDNQRKSEKPSSGSRKNRVQEVGKTEFKKSENPPISDTDLSDTDLSDTDYNINHHHEGFSKKQSDLINEFASKHNLKIDDDVLIKLVSKLKNYKPNSLEYIEKVYETITTNVREFKSYKENTYSDNGEELFKEWERKNKELKEEQKKKSPDQLDQEKAEIEKLLNQYK